MPPKKGLGPLTEEEVQARMNKLVGVITNQAQKEIVQVSAQSTEDIDEMKKSLVAEPKQIIDEWVEKLRAFTERQTKIHCARLRRIAKLRILEAYGDIRESIKNEARDRIKDKMSKKSEESDRILRDMLFQGLLRLMESKVLVHTTKADLGRVSQHYDSVTKKYKEATGNDLKLITSRHPLKDQYFGRIVISDKLSTTFVDMNLYTSVDKVADEVFAHYATYQDKAGTSKNWGMEALKQRGLHIMPRGPTITSFQLDSILSTLRGDPRTQAPVFQIKEETKKHEEEDDDNPAAPHCSSASSGNKRRVSSNVGKTRKVMIAAENTALAGMKPSLSMMEPGGFAPSKYNYRQAQDTSDHVLGTPSDLYNLDFTSTTDLLSQVPSRVTLATSGKPSMASEPGFTAAKAKSVSADKEAPKAVGKVQQGGRSASVERRGSRFSAESEFSDYQSDTSSPLAPPLSGEIPETVKRPSSSPKGSASSGSPSRENKERSKKKK